MEIDVDWVYREFLRRGYRQEYAADFIDQAWKNGGKEVETHQRTEPDTKLLPPEARGIMDDRKVMAVARKVGLPKYM